MGRAVARYTSTAGAGPITNAQGLLERSSPISRSVHFSGGLASQNGWGSKKASGSRARIIHYGGTGNPASQGMAVRRSRTAGQRSRFGAESALMSADLSRSPANRSAYRSPPLAANPDAGALSRSSLGRPASREERWNTA